MATAGTRSSLNVLEPSLSFVYGAFDLTLALDVALPRAGDEDRLPAREARLVAAVVPRWGWVRIGNGALALCDTAWGKGGRGAKSVREARGA